MKKLVFKVDPQRPCSLTAQVALGLKNAICTGRLKVGDSLPPRAVLSKNLGVSESVIRAALRELTADRIVVGRPRRGHVVTSIPSEKRKRLILDVSTENLGSYSSRISTEECARLIRKNGHAVQPVVLGVDARNTAYLRPLQEALRLRPDLVLVRVTSTRRKVVDGLLASYGCPYVTLTMGKISRSPGRFEGNLRHNTDDAVSCMAAAAVQAGVKSVLQVDFGDDAYASAVTAFRRQRISVERLSLSLAPNQTLDDIVDSARIAVEGWLDHNCRPDLVYASDDYLSLGVCEALRHKGLECPRDVRLVVYANRGSGLFPFGDKARIEFDPLKSGQETARCLLEWMETGVLGCYDNPHRFIRGKSFAA